MVHIPLPLPEGNGELLKQLVSLISARALDTSLAGARCVRACVRARVLHV